MPDQVEAAAAAQQQAAEAADAQAAEAAEAGERPQKRARLKGGKAAAGAPSKAKAKPAEAASPAIRAEWHRFAETLASAERAAQVAEVRSMPDSLSVSSGLTVELLAWRKLIKNHSRHILPSFAQSWPVCHLTCRNNRFLFEGACVEVQPSASELLSSSIQNPGASPFCVVLYCAGWLCLCVPGGRSGDGAAGGRLAAPRRGALVGFTARDRTALRRTYATMTLHLQSPMPNTYHRKYALTVLCCLP